MQLSKPLPIAIYVLLWMRMIMQPLAELRETLQNATLKPVAEIRESDKRWLVAYRIEGEGLFPQMRPGVLQLVFEPSGWQAGFCEQPGTIMVAAAAARQPPRLKIAVLGEIPEEHLQHFVCRVAARFPNGESVAPVFCCSWPQESEEVAQMRAEKYGGLQQRLRKEILGGVRGALAELEAERRAERRILFSLLFAVAVLGGAIGSALITKQDGFGVFP